MFCNRVNGKCQIKGDIMVMDTDKNKVRQRKWVYVTTFLAAILFFTNVSEADFATPFVEINNKVGDISEAHGYVVALSRNAEGCTSFLVIVATDEEQHVVINATARRKLITRAFIGRPVTIRAKIIKRSENSKNNKTEIELEILSVRPPGKQKRRSNKSKIIIPGIRVGGYKLGMSKDNVLKSLGKPKMISYKGETYNLDNLPRIYFMHFDDVSFKIVGGSAQAIVVHSPVYKFNNGLGVGNSEQEFKQAFGLQFKFEEDQGKLYLTYKDKGLQFVIHKENRTVIEFTVTKNIPRGH